MVVPVKRHGLDAEALEVARDPARLRRDKSGQGVAGERVGKDALGGAFRVEVLGLRRLQRKGRGGAPLGAQRRECGGVRRDRDVHGERVKA
jgi:hypothetical protein